MQRYFRFRSTGSPGVMAVTDDRAGARLPAEQGPWQFDAEVATDRDWHGGPPKAVAAAGVLENGFALWDAPSAPAAAGGEEIVHIDVKSGR